MSPHPFRSPFLRPLVLVPAIVLVVAGVLVARTFLKRGGTQLTAATEAVARRDISQTVEATGTVEPIVVVEIKSKASGQILRMPVEIGSVVRAGDLLAQIDTVNVQNQYDEASAALKAAQANVQITAAQAKRADELYSREVITADSHESATLAYANAQSALVRARSDLEIAKQALDDATVRAPSNGTIIEQDVTKGQVIASATSSASGGTTLLKMADLSKVQMQVLVGETDIGNVKPGQAATVTVDAFPNRTFQGTVLKIEPQAQVDQSVTMFPVLVSLSNENGQLLPGMNGEVVIAIDQRTNVLAVPIDAVRTAKELPAVATTLGLNADSLRAQVQRQVAAAMSARAAAGGDSTRRGWSRAARDSARARWARGGTAERSGEKGGDFGPPPGGPPPDMMGGGPPPGGPGGPGEGGAWGGRGGRGGFGGDRAAWRARRMAWANRQGGAGGGGAAGGPGGEGGFGGGNATTSAAATATHNTQTQVVLVKTAGGLEPRVVKLGISDYDYTEVLSGLKEGEEVALLSVAEVQAKRQSDQAQIRQRMGTGIPGVGGSSSGRSSGGARAAGGGR